MTPEERFWSRVDVTPGCWIWTGSKHRKGYGAQHVRSLPRLAHRCAYHLAVGPIPAGLHVLHRCDNPSCVNPDHLFVGTNDDNVADRVAKGRTVAHKGERHAHAKLTDADVLEIRRRCAAGEKLQAVATEYGISETAVSFIRLGRSWRHLGGERSERKAVAQAGQRYGRLVLVRELDPIVYPGRSSKVRVWLVRCDCGTEKPARVDSVRIGETRSCGCLKSEAVIARNRLGRRAA